MITRTAWTTRRPATARASWQEATSQLWGGAAAFSVTSHPIQLATMLASGLPRHGMTVAAAILSTAHVWGDRPALTDGRGTLSYRELGHHTLRLAGGLAERGIRPGMRIALQLADDRRLLITLGACSLLGARVSMLNPRLGVTDLTDHLSQAGIGTLIGPSAPALVRRHIPDDSLQELAQRATEPPPRWHARRSQLVMLTGGTTGAPTGIQIVRRTLSPLAALALAGGTGVRHGATTLVCAPLFHGYGLASAMLALIAGSPLLLTTALRSADISATAKGGAARFDWGEAIFAAIHSHRVGTLVGVPAHFTSLAHYLEGAHELTGHTHLHSIVSGADCLAAATVATLHRIFGPIATNYYGTTETGTVTLASGVELEAHPGTVGRPIVGARVEIVNESGQVLPCGAVGRIRLHSALASVTDADGTGFTTSDLGRLDEAGYLYVLGRAAGPVRMGGEFVDLERVVGVLEAVPGVARAQVWVSDGAEAGMSRVFARVEVAPDHTATEAELRTAVRVLLGPAATPAQIEMVGTGQIG